MPPCEFIGPDQYTHTLVKDRVRTIQWNGDIIFLDDLDGIKFDMDNLLESAVKVCRFNGHTRFHYSNLQHMTNVARMCKEPELKYACLLHDVHEIVIGDLTQPLIKALPPIVKEYITALKHSLDVVIAKQFDCPELIDPKYKNLIKYYDEQMTNNEGRQLHPNSEPWFDSPEIPFCIQQLPNYRVMDDWWDLYWELSKDRECTI